MAAFVDVPVSVSLTSVSGRHPGIA